MEESELTETLKKVIDSRERIICRYNTDMEDYYTGVAELIETEESETGKSETGKSETEESETEESETEENGNPDGWGPIAFAKDLLRLNSK